MLIDRPVAGDAHQPRDRRPQLDVVGVGARPHLDEDLLQHLLGFAAVPEDAQDQAVQQPTVTIVQLANRPAVAGDHATDQRDVGTSVV